MRGGGAVPPRPIFPDVLIEATIKAIRAGMKPDDFSKPANINANLNAGLNNPNAQQSTTANQFNKSGKECCLRKVSPRFAKGSQKSEVCTLFIIMNHKQLLASFEINYIFF